MPADRVQYFEPVCMFVCVGNCEEVRGWHRAVGTGARYSTVGLHWSWTHVCWSTVSC